MNTRSDRLYVVTLLDMQRLHTTSISPEDLRPDLFQRSLLIGAIPARIYEFIGCCYSPALIESFPSAYDPRFLKTLCSIQAPLPRLRIAE